MATLTASTMRHILQGKSHVRPGTTADLHAWTAGQTGEVEREENRIRAR